MNIPRYMMQVLMAADTMTDLETLTKKDPVEGTHEYEYIIKTAQRLPEVFDHLPRASIGERLPLMRTHRIEVYSDDSVRLYSWCDFNETMDLIAPPHRHTALLYRTQDEADDLVNIARDLSDVVTSAFDTVQEALEAVKVDTICSLILGRIKYSKSTNQSNGRALHFYLMDLSYTIMNKSDNHHEQYALLVNPRISRMLIDDGDKPVKPVKTDRTRSNSIHYANSAAELYLKLSELLLAQLKLAGIQCKVHPSMRPTEATWRHPDE